MTHRRERCCGQRRRSPWCRCRTAAPASRQCHQLNTRFQTERDRSGIKNKKLGEKSERVACLQHLPGQIAATTEQAGWPSALLEGKKRKKEKRRKQKNRSEETPRRAQKRRLLSASGRESSPRANGGLSLRACRERERVRPFFPSPCSGPSARQRQSRQAVEEQQDGSRRRATRSRKETTGRQKKIQT